MTGDEGRNESTLRFCSYGLENDGAIERWEGALVREMRIMHSFLSYGAQNEEKHLSGNLHLALYIKERILEMKTGL